MKATKMAIERFYQDNSSVEFAVRLNGMEFEIECVDKIQIPIDEINWFIDALCKVKHERLCGTCHSFECECECEC